MSSTVRSTAWRRLTAAAAVVVSMACTPSAGEGRDVPVAGAAQRDGQVLVIDHVAPERDSTGRAPVRFEWTPAPGADRYAIGIWDEVDRLIWRRDDVQATSVARPDDLLLEPGTYFWSVSALSGGRQIAESGLSAFVVTE